jgi:Winged helix-turn helix
MPSLAGLAATNSPMLFPLAGGSGAVIKLGELVMILDLHRQGLSVSAIARQLCVDRKTVRSTIAKGPESDIEVERRRRRRMLSGQRDHVATNAIGIMTGRPWMIRRPHAGGGATRTLIATGKQL